MEPQHSIRPDFNIEDYNLAQILQLALETRSLNYYALALAKSRNAQPDQLTVSLTLQLLQISGPKWSEVLERQAVNNYQLVYSVACEHRLALDVLVGLAKDQGHIQELKSMCLRILHYFEEGGQVWPAFYVLLNISLQLRDYQYKFQLLSNVNRLVESKKLPVLLHNLAAQQVDLENQINLDKNVVTVFNIYTAIIELYSKCSKYVVKRGQLGAFNNMNQSLVNYFYEIFGKAATYINHYSSQIQSQSSHIFKETLITHALQCLQKLAHLPILQLTFVDNAQSLIQVLTSLPLLRPANSIEDRLNFQYGVSFGEFGEDVQSVLAKTIVVMSANVPAILRQTLVSIKAKITSHNDSNVVAFGLVLLSVIGKLVVVRDDLVAEIVTPLLEYLISNSNEQTPLELKCRIMRALLFYGQIISQNQFHHLLTSTLDLLRYQPCKSFGFHEADNIFQIFVQKSHQGPALGRFSTLIKQSLNHSITILSEVVTQTRQVTSTLSQEKAMRLVKLIRMLMDKNQRQVTDISGKVMRNSIAWLLNEIKLAWSKGIKHNVLIYQIAVLLKQAVFLVDMEQEYVNDASDQLYKVFQLLLYPERLEIMDQVIEILYLKIEKEQMIDGKLCTAIVTSLQSVVNYEKSNLGSVSNILKALNTPDIAKHIMFEWGDLVNYLSNLYIDYFVSYLHQAYLNFYSQQLSEIASYFEKFLQTYQTCFESKPQIRVFLLQNIRKMPSCEWRCRFFLILNHQVSLAEYDIFSLEEACKSTKRGTMKLIFFYYIDKLIQNYSQNTLNQFLQFNKIFEEKKLRREFKDEPLQGIPYPQINLKTYLYQGFRELKKKNNIDSVQYSSLLKDFKLE